MERRAASSSRRKATRPPPAELLEEAINDIVRLAREQGMSEEETDIVIYRMADKIADKYRSNFELRDV